MEGSSLTRLAAFCLVALLAAPAAALAQAPVPPEVTRKIQTSYTRGVAWLLKAQNPDGSWGLEPGSPPDIGCTCVALLSLMSVGSTPSRGPHARAVRRGLDWVIRLAKRHNNAIPRSNSSLIPRKLGTEIEGFLVCLLLGEAMGMEHDRARQEAMRRAVEKMVKVIGSQQKPDGSWNSQVFAPLLATASAWMALRTAYMAGIDPGKASVEKTLAYVKQQIDPASGVFQGVWRGRGTQYRFYGQACGLRVLIGMNLHEDKLTQSAIKALLKFKYQPYHHRFNSEGENYMAAWYSTQALFQERTPGKPLYKRWYRELCATLLKNQEADGSWRGTACITSRVFSTACAVLSMTVPLRTLPMTEY